MVVSPPPQELETAIRFERPAAIAYSGSGKFVSLGPPFFPGP
ncbi:MAG: hypothetical protein QXG60_03055 [Thermoplasmata archaeon]